MNPSNAHLANARTPKEFAGTERGIEAPILGTRSRKTDFGTQDPLSVIFHSFACRDALSWTCMQLREYIHDQLYRPSDGYFQRKTSPISYLPTPISFGSLLGRTEYLRAVKQAYESLQVGSVRRRDMSRQEMHRY